MTGRFAQTEYRHIPLFADVTEEQWNNWRWQVKYAIQDIPTLSRVVDLSDEERGILSRCLKRFRMAITPYYAALMDRGYRRCPIRLQGVPRIEELELDTAGLRDPLNEEANSPVPGLIHRYPDRVLLLVTNRCPMYCRHCTRRRIVGDEDLHLSREDMDRAFEYIRKTRGIRDVFISGGEPFAMSDERIGYVLGNLRKIPHVEIIRIATRAPVVLPQRITPGLVETLRKHHPVYVDTQFNHPREITAEAEAACDLLVDAGIPMGNQAVLLRDVNDCPALMKKLMQDLLLIRVKPYYIYQCDMSEGIAHFRTSIVKGIEIIENLRGHTTGMGVPTFVVDAPGGAGKIPIMPNYIVSQSDHRVILRNYEGVITTYTEPERIETDCGRCEICRDERYRPREGVAKLLSGEQLALRPEGLRQRMDAARLEGAQRPDTTEGELM